MRRAQSGQTGREMEITVRYAHSGNEADRSDWQLLSDHLEATAILAGSRAAPLGLRSAATLAGRLHDLGKVDPEFDRVLRGDKIRVDHSTAGAKVLMDQAAPGLKPVAEVLAYAILGHHAGLPDKRNPTASCLTQRLADFRGHDPAAPAVTDAELVAIGQELQKLCRPGSGFDLSVAARMIFSCLVDADYRDTETYYDRLEGRERPRDWPALADLLPRLTTAFDAHMAGFTTDSDVNRLRANILTHVREQSSQAPGLFTLTVPTGGGKTLASMGFALDHARMQGHRRIIYAIPYTSIIDQTAAIFRDLFGADVVLEHHSQIDTDNPGQEGRDKLRLAMEDWAVPIVVTTNVQLFESLFAARPSRARKLHNIAGSVIVLDEAQCLPRKLLLPVLRMIDTLAGQYGCSVVLCTATQPAFDNRHLKHGLPLAGRELAPDPEELARRLRRARIVRGGDMDDIALIAALRDTPQGLVIVNSRAHALDLFRAATGAGLEGLIHLTTRQYPAHRRRIIDEVGRRLKAGEPCRLVATSLVEAGVDLDFPKAWRAEAGLDSVIQAAGRVNREGRRSLEDSLITVFSATAHAAPADVRLLAEDMRRIAGRQTDLLAPEAISDWFGEVYWRSGPDRLGLKLADCMKVTALDGTDFPFRTLAEEFRMIDSPMVPVIVPRDEEAQTWVAKLGLEQISSGAIARALQRHIVQIPAKARGLLVANGHASFRRPDMRGDQFCVLENPSLYYGDSGLWWEQAEYLAAEVGVI
jgi:CRISPR-associated endonuclease/helicase Cas3